MSVKGMFVCLFSEVRQGSLPPITVHLTDGYTKTTLKLVLAMVEEGAQD